MTSDTLFYAKLLVRRLPAMIVLFVLATAIGVVVALRLPTLYQTNATLLVEVAQLPEEMLRNGLQLDTTKQLEVIQKRLLTRANLISVARNNTVFPDQGQMNPDDVVSEMNRRTTMRLISGRDRATLMVVGFEDALPRRAAAVVNEYVTLILAMNTELRVERSEGALSFFEQEVETLARDLEKQSNEIAAFQNLNSDALPESLSFRMDRQSLLQERLARLGRDIEALERQRASITALYETTGQLQSTQAAVERPEQARLRELERQLSAALAVYSDQHPRVKLLENQISQQRDDLEDILKRSVATDSDLAVVDQVSVLDASLVELNAQLESFIQETDAVTEQLTLLQDTIERTPANAIALEAMLRDQENLQSSYTAAVQRLSQARMSVRIESSARGERITVLEPANVPNSPSGPNRPLIMGMGVGVGGGLAVGLFLFLELINTSIRRSADIVNKLGVTPLATLPRLETASHRRKRRVLQILTLVGIVAGVLAILWGVDRFYIPVDQLLQRVLARIL